MTDHGVLDKAGELDKALAENQDQNFVLSLYVTGLNSKSQQAIDMLKTICETELKGRYKLEIIDLSKNPALAKKENIIATPTLIRQLPLPLRRVIGNLSNKERVILGLNLKQKN